MQVGRDLQQFVNIPEGRIHYVKIGSGYPVVVCHAGGNSTESWLPVMDILGQHFTCYGFDMMGHGQSDEPPGESFSIPDFARTTCHAMKALNIPKAHFIGNLAGASLSIEMAASYPERVDKLVLAPPPVVDPRMTARRMSGVDSLWDENGLALPRDAEHMTSNGGFVNPKPEWIDQLNRSRAQGGKWTRIITINNAWYDMVARLPLIKATATLVISGEHVGFGFREIEDIFIYNLPNASKVVLPATGNFLFMEDPQGFSSAALEFLK